MTDDGNLSEIIQLIYKVAHAIDEGDFEAYADLFARCTFTMPGGRTMRGRAEVLAQARDTVLLYDGSPRTLHLVQNPVVELGPDGTSAVAVSYAQVLQEVLPDFPLQTIGVSRYEDSLTRDAAGWHFDRRVAQRVLTGDLSRHMRSAPGH